MMQLPIPRSHRLHRRSARKPPAPPALVLASAVYSEGLWVRLTFDRPVQSPAGMNVAAVYVDDGDIGSRFRGTGTATLFGPATVQVGVANVGPTPVEDTRLTAGADTGLAAADDGGAWAGVAAVALPFP